MSEIQQFAVNVNPPKSGVTAGVLQLLFGWLGIGRFYLGYGLIGGIQLGLTILSFLLMPFGIPAFVIIWPVVGIWVFIEAFVMMAGGIREHGGRKTR